MLTPRIIPCLLVHKKGLVKTVRFRDPKYVGDPINAVRIFNEKQVDELMLLDIDATKEGRGPDFAMVERIAAECRMPLCYGGGVTSPDDAEHLIGLGVEKVAFGSAAIQTPQVLSQVAERLGSQSVVAVLDVKDTSSGGHILVTHNATVAHPEPPLDMIKTLTQAGAGEMVINCVSRDGTGIGYDIPFAVQARLATGTPMTFLGGAGSLEHMTQLFSSVGVVGAAAGSLFVFKGKLRAVLISYPDSTQRPCYSPNLRR